MAKNSFWDFREEKGETDLELDEVTESVIGAAIEVHKILGPGLSDTRVDLLVAEKVIVELKACDGIHPIHRAQTICYLQLLHQKVGLIINFNVPVLRDGIKRVVATYP